MINNTNFSQFLIIDAASIDPKSHLHKPIDGPEEWDVSVWGVNGGEND